jgi:hypothetical protein
VSGQLAIGSLTDAGLFTQSFSANTILTRFTDATLECRHGFPADHAFFVGFAH